MWAFPRSAVTTVGDRSLLTEIVALLVAASIAWPGSGYTCARQAASATIVPVVASTVGHPLMRARNQGFKAVPERHLSKLGGVLDDDPAMLSDDWIEDLTGLLAACPAAHAQGTFSMAAAVVAMNAGLPPTPRSPIHVLCRYQC
jgi:hypothetical protein